MSDKPKPPPERDARGQYRKGQSGNAGGRASMPSWFREKGPDALKVLLEVMEGTQDDEKISRAQAAMWVVERVYGRVAAAKEDQEAQVNAMTSLLMALAEQRK